MSDERTDRVDDPDPLETAHERLLRWVGRHGFAVDGLLHRACARLLGAEDLPPRRLAWRLFREVGGEVDEATARALACLDSRVAEGAVRCAPPPVAGVVFPGVAQMIGHGSWAWAAAGGVWPEEMAWDPEMEGLAGAIPAVRAGHDALSVHMQVALGPQGKREARALWERHVGAVRSVLAACEDVLEHGGAADLVELAPRLHASLVPLFADFGGRLAAWRATAEERRRRAGMSDRRSAARG